MNRLPSSPVPPPPHVFVVRLWFEPSESLPGGGEWRGSVRESSSGRLVYFRHMDGVVGALRQLRNFTAHG